MTIRIVRFKIADTGNDFTDYETIATSLNKKDFSAEEIKKLYHMRWGIETSFRELKYAVGLTRLHTKTSAAMQEVLARLIMYNFCECITMSIVIEQKDSRKWTYSSYALSQTNKLMSQTFDPLYSYNLKVTVADYFYSVEQIISIGTKQVLLDFLSNGTESVSGRSRKQTGILTAAGP